MDARVHELLEPLSFLLGTWRGKGEGVYPTVDAFVYEEEAFFTHTGRPFLVYSSKTWHPDDGRPMHSESGFIRAVGGDHVELVVAHAFGNTEIGEGSVSSRRLQVRSINVMDSSTAKRVDAVSRALEVNDDVLHYDIGMAFGGHELQNHLKATLGRI